MATDQLNSIAPMLAVREALGLSIDDAAAILEESPGTVIGLDSQPIEELAELASSIGSEGGKVFLKIKNADDSTFREWEVTSDGYLVDPRES